MFKKTIWKDRGVQKPRTYRPTNNADGTVTLTPEPGQIYEVGTTVNAAQLNRMEKGIWEALFSSSDLPWGGITRTPTYDPATADITQSGEVIVATGKLLRRRTYGYTGENLTTANIKVYADDGVTVIGEVTDTLSYNADGDWTGTTRVVIV